MPRCHFQLSGSEFKLLQNLLVQESGLLVAADRQETLRSVLLERMEHHRFSTVGEYYRLLTSDLRNGAEIKCFIELLTIGETYFFRSFPQFHALEQKVLAPLIQERLRGPRTLTLWSAGCSTGEEPYSLAILLLETLPFPETWVISLLATDVNREAIKKAQQAVYSSRSVHDIPEPWLKKYFTRQGDKYHLHENVKRMVRFRYLNLAKDPFTQPGMRLVDALFCRNVMIYFPLDVTKRIIAQFREALCDGGYFFIGGAETLWQISDQFSQVEFANALLYRKENVTVTQDAEPFIELPPRASIVPKLTDVEPPPARIHTILTNPQAIQKAWGLANQGQYDEAIPILKNVVLSDNLSSEVHYLLGVLYEKKGELDHAIVAFERSLYVDPTLSISHFALASIYQYQQRPLKARREFENAVKTLARKPDAELVPMSEDMTCGFLRTACSRHLESLSK